MIVVGGVYSEYCYHPTWHQIFGSGGRGAAVLSTLGIEPVTLITAFPKTEGVAVRASLVPYGVHIQEVTSQHLYEFAYTHPLSEPSLQPLPIAPAVFPDLIKDTVVLVYGMLEGLPTVEADWLVYDPQSEVDVVAVETFVRKHKNLALVLNEHEIKHLTGLSDAGEAARSYVQENKASVVVVKRGPFGCIVVDSSGTYTVPVYPSLNVFKIGSGDVFSAAFTKFWAVDHLGALESAQNASRCASLYCDSKSIDAIVNYSRTEWSPREARQTPRVYLAGPFFSLSQRFLVEEARRSLVSLGAEVFSPLHEVGMDAPTVEIAKRDLEGLERCTVVLALIADLDPGTIFEIGFARARNIPVVAYGEGVKDEHLTMLIGSDCVYLDDFCSALYNAVWAGM